MTQESVSFLKITRPGDLSCGSVPGSPSPQCRPQKLQQFHCVLAYTYPALPHTPWMPLSLDALHSLWGELLQVTDGPLHHPLDVLRPQKSPTHHDPEWRRHPRKGMGVVGSD